MSVAQPASDVSIEPRTKRRSLIDPSCRTEVCASRRADRRRAPMDRGFSPDSYFLPSTVSLNAFATEKPTFFRAGILIASPV